jgi:hypothetical protein
MSFQDRTKLYFSNLKAGTANQNNFDNATRQSNSSPASASAFASVTQQHISHFRRHRGTAAPSSLRMTATRARLSGMLAVMLLLLFAAGAHAQGVFATWQNLGTAVTQTVPVIASVAGTVSSVEVLTSGSTGLDFTQGTGTVTSSCSAAVLAAGGTCNVSVTFTPKYPGLRKGAVVLLNATNTVLGTTYLSGVGQGGLDVLTPGNVLEIAGVLKQDVSTQNGIPATQANLRQPASVVLDGAGNIYIADAAHNEVRMVCAAANSAIIAGVVCPGAGIIVDIAGTGNAGYMGFGVPASTSELNGPGGLALDGAGNLYIADTGNNVVREITAATGNINTIAGDGTAGYGGDGSLATAAGVELNAPWGVTIDPTGNLYIADTSNQRIRVVSASTGIITTVAGNGIPSGLGDGKGTFSGNGGPANAAGLSLPYAVAFDTSGDMFIPDSANNQIRIVKATGGVITPTSTIQTFVGSSQPGADCTNILSGSATFSSPEGVAVDPAGNLYISDTGDSCVRKMNVSSGMVTALAYQLNLVTGSPDYTISLLGVAGTANVFSPAGITLDGLGNVYYADYYYMLINEIQSNEAVLNYTATPIRQGSQSSVQIQAVENDGNATSSITSITPDQNSIVDAATTTCAPNPFTLAEDADCNVGAIFAPSLTINPTTLPATIDANITVANNTVNSPLDIVLIGNALAINSTTIALTSAPNPAAFGTKVTMTATVTTGAGTGSLTGTVTFSDTFNGVTTQLGAPVVVTGAGVAVLTSTTLAVGTHNLTAVYNGDSSHGATPAGSAATATEVIYEGTKVVLTAAPASPSPVGATVVFTATVTAPNGGGIALDGNVTFTDAQAVFPANTVALTGSGVETYTTAAMVQGINAITATYTPATTPQIQGSTATLNQDVVGTDTLTLTSAPNPSNYGSTVTFSVSIPNSGTTPATGKVNIVLTPVGATTPTYPLTITLAGNPAAGTATISTLPVGSYNATATYAGDNNYGAAAASLAAPQVVNQVTATTTVVAAANPGLAGKPDVITATVAGPAGSTITPTGTVTFTYTLNGTTTTLGTGAITLVKGVATVTANLPPGTYPIVATYSGDTDDAAGTPGTLSLVINAAVTTTTVTATPSPAIVGQTITFAATVTSTGVMPTGTVAFTATGGGVTITLPSGILNASGQTSVTSSTLAAGTYTITATYSGDTDNGAGTPATTTEVVGLIPTTTDLASGSTSGTNPQAFLIAVVQNSGNVGSTPVPTGNVTFTSGAITGTVALDANGVANWTPNNLGTGNYTFTASYAGDAEHSPSKSAVSVTITGSGSYFSLSLPSTISIPTTQNVTVTVTLTSINGFADTVGLGCASLPAGVNCHFSSINVPLTANGTATAKLTIDTNNPLGGGASAMNRQSGQRNVVVAGLFLPLSLLMGFLMWRFRKRHPSVWSIVLVLVLSGAALLATGCGGFTQTSAAPGSYPIQVVGAGVQSGLSESQAVTLTITQ